MNDALAERDRRRARMAFYDEFDRLNPELDPLDDRLGFRLRCFIGSVLLWFTEPAHKRQAALRSRSIQRELTARGISRRVDAEREAA